MSIDFSFLDTFEQKRILIVDDDRFIRGVLDKMLRMIGFESIAHAEDGDIALEVMDEHADRYTVVSLFQLRPDMQLAEDIKTRNKTVLMPARFTLTQTRIHRMWELEANLEKTSFRVVGGWTLD